MGALFLGSKVEESFTRLTYMVAVYDYLLRKARKQPTYPPLDAFSQVSWKEIAEAKGQKRGGEILTRTLARVRSEKHDNHWRDANIEASRI